MAIQEPDETEQDPRKRQQAGAQDPLFYEGTTPVLGEAVSLQEPKGELGFPQASPAAAPMQGPAPTAPVAPNFPAFPEFGPFTPPEWTFEYGAEPPTKPTAPTIQLPQEPDVPWWSKALAIGGAAGDLYKQGKDIYKDAQAAGQWAPAGDELGAGGWWAPGIGGEIAGEGFGVTPGTGNLESFGGAEVGATPTGAGDTTAAWAPTGYIGPALSALGAGLGAYSAYQAEPGSPQQLSSGLGAVGGAAGAAGGLMGGTIGGAGLAGGLATGGPVAAALALPFVLGGLYHKFGPPSEDKIQAPPGWKHVIGTGNSRGVGGYVVDPSTGRLLHYTGKGQYEPAGIMTAEQMQQKEIEPTGALLAQPGYAQVPEALRAADIARAGTALPGATVGGGVFTPSPQYQQQTLTMNRQATIDQLTRANPGASEGELWRQYTLTPQYQQELALQAGWNQDQGAPAAYTPPAPAATAPAPAPAPAAPKPGGVSMADAQNIVTQAYQKYFKRMPTAQEVQQQITEANARGETADQFLARLRAHFGY